MRSNSATYLPPDVTGPTGTIDCSVDKPPVKCFGGAAPTLITDFPKNNGRYFVTQFTPEANFDIKSENALRWYEGYPVNYLITNNLSAANRAMNVTGGARERVADTFRDYYLSCRDNWGNTTHSLTVTIADENDDYPSGTHSDDYPDWDGP